MTDDNDTSEARSAKRRRTNTHTVTVPLNDRTSSLSSRTLNNSKNTSANTSFTEGRRSDRNDDNISDDDDDDDDEDHRDTASSSSGSEIPPPDFDPNQDIEERRKLRRGYRQLDRDIQDQAQEYMAPESQDLEHAVLHSTTLHRSVKQTADAVLDSSFLAKAGDLAYRKSRSINVGESAQGIDLDEFVGKCISFMQASADEAPDVAGQTATQRRRRQAARDAEEDGDDDDGRGDALDWEALGARACQPHNMRPPVPGFLLGPLSVQKRARKAPVERRARNARATQNAPEVKAGELTAADLGRGDGASLTLMCDAMWRRLSDAQAEGQAAIGSYYDALDKNDDDLTEEQEREMLSLHAMCADGGVSLLRFAVNPASFGQTVENLFHLSFLVRDSRVEVTLDPDGAASLHWHDKEDREDPAAQEQARGRGGDAGRNQAVLSIDFDTWRQAAEVVGGEQCLVGNREEVEERAVGAGGWY